MAHQLTKKYNMRFTPYIKTMQVQDCPSEVLKAVKEVLEHVMRKKGLWHLPPAILGFTDYENWEIEKQKSINTKKHTPFTTTNGFEALTFYCFTYAITERLRHLKNALAQGSDNIDGLVVKNIENGLLELQKKHDDIGYYLARNARLSIEELLKNKRVKAQPLSKKNTVNNHTLVFFPPFQTTEPSSETQLEDIVKKIINWQTDLPIISKQDVNPTTQTRMMEIISKLGEAVLCFRFRSLMQVLKAGAWRESEPEWIYFNQWDDAEAHDSIDDLLPPLPDTALDWPTLESLKSYIYSRCKTKSEIQIWTAIIDYFEQYQTVPSTRTIADQTNMPKSTVSDVQQKIKTYLQDYCSDNV